MWKTRVLRDMEQLRKEGFRVRNDKGEEELTDLHTFVVNMIAPKDSMYEGFEYDLRFTMTEQFPFKSPSVGFVQRILHPNVDENSGSICLDSLNKAWSPAFSLLNIVQTQLPYLLQYPNPNDPFNREAASFLSRDAEGFKRAVAAHCARFARRVTDKQTNG
jgi:ubiquitin-conjugating enzyme E2 H